MQFRVLGPLEVDAGEGPVPLGGPKQRAVLANLLVRANEVVPADTLIDEVWGDEPPGQARNTLQTYVSNLRKALGDGMLEGRAPGYVLVVDPLAVDAARFDALVREARKTLPIDPKVAIDSLEDALAMWRGPALADVAERSLLAEAARLDEMRIEAQEERIGALLSTGSAARAIGELEPLLAAHPLRERLWEQVMLALYREGRQAEALAAFQRARELLADELGIDPSPELVRLHGQILAQDASLELRGEPLRGYRLLEKLGETRSGIRFRAIQPRVGRDVEIEVLHEHVAGSLAFVERFEPEAQAVAALEHPHIVPMYDYWREPGRAYLVRRYLRGPSLRTLQERDEKVEPRRALVTIEQVASALAHAHRQGVAHGDIGDDSVLFDAERNAYLGGFAIAVGPAASAHDDVQRFGSLVRRLLGRDLPEQLAVVIDRSDGPEPPDAVAFAEATRAAIADGAGSAVAAPDDDPPRNPYRGLRAFTEAQAPDFFGRAVAVRQVLERLAVPGPEGRFVAVVGPSGCGKSSLVRAGVVPALRGGIEGRPVLVTDLIPGAHPYDELEAALARVAVRSVRRSGEMLRRSSRGLLEAVERAVPGDADVVVVIDQFEELFTLTEDEVERTDFLECIRVACADPDSRVRVIATLRADFYDRPLLYARFGELLASQTEAIAPLQPDELEQAIRAPAERAGVHPEPGLVADMIADAARQPGALPLIQFALTQLFDRRSDGGMTRATYRDLGGIVGTLSTSADDVVGRADRDERRAIRQILLRLVSLGEGRADTRRRLARSALDRLDLDRSMIDRVLDTFGRLRILTFDREPATREPTVEIAHEALLDAWPRLRRWIDEARVDLHQEAILTLAAEEWLVAERDPSFLVRGARLEQTDAWVRTTDLVLGHDVRRYVAASVAAREEERSAEERRRVREAETERRSARRLRGLVAVFAAAALIAGSLTLVATGQGRRAEREGALSAVRELDAASAASLDVDPERAVLLAIEAAERSRASTGAPVPEAEEALHRAIAASRVVMTKPGLGGSVATGPGGAIATLRMEHPGEVVILDAQGRISRTIEAHEGEVNDVAFTADGARLVTAGSDGWFRNWNLGSGDLVWEVHRPGAASRISLDANGDLVAAGWPSAGRILVADAGTGRVLQTFPCESGSSCLVALSPDGTRIAVDTTLRPDGVEAGWIVPTFAREPRVTFQAPPWTGINGSLSWSPDGRYVSGSSFVWDAGTGALLHTAEHGPFVESSGWSPDGTRLVTGSGGTARVWDVDSTGFRSTLALSAAGGLSSTTDVAFSTDGEEVVTATSDALRVWDVRPLGNEERASLPLSTEYASQLRFTPQGQLVVAADVREDRAGLFGWDLAEGAATTIGTSFRLPNPQSMDVNPVDGSVVLVIDDGSVVVIAESSVRRLPFEASRARWTPDGSHLLVTPTDRSVAMVGLDGREVWRSPQPLSIGTLDVAKDGRIVLTGGDAGGDTSIIQLNAADGSIISTITIPRIVAAVALDPRGETIATMGEEAGSLQSWDVETGQLVGTYPIETTGEPGFVFSPDGSTLAVMHWGDQVVRLYDTDDRQLRLTLPPPDDLLGDGPTRSDGDPRCFAQSVAFNGDGSLLAAQGCAGVRVWALDIDELLAIARANVTRSLTADECRRYLHVDTCPST